MRLLELQFAPNVRFIRFTLFSSQCDRHTHFTDSAGMPYTLTTEQIPGKSPWTKPELNVREICRVAARRLPLPIFYPGAVYQDAGYLSRAICLSQNHAFVAGCSTC